MDILMAIVDFIPVGLFLAAAIFLQRDLYNKMSKGAFALFAAGTILVFCVGTLKALHKLLYYAAGLNFYSLSASFFPMQTLGFVLAGAGLVAMCVHKQGEHAAYSVVPLFILPLLVNFKEMEDNSSTLTMVFVGLMCAGVAVMFGILAYFSAKMKNWWSFALLIVGFVCTLGMGYLSTKEDMSDWYKEIVNSCGQGSLLAAALILHRKGFGKADAVKGMVKGE